MTLQHSKHPDWDEVWGQVQYGDTNWLRDYIESHDINQCTDEHGNTLLHCAVRDEKRYAIPYLSHFFIDPNIKNAAGQTALQLARDMNPGCLWALREHHLCIDFSKASTKPNGVDALFVAIYRGDATLGDASGVEDNGNEKNADGWTALHCAVVYDRPHLIRELHQRFPKLGANYLNYDECSALRLAIMRSHSNCIIALCECFPAIKAGDALQAVCKYNRSACIPTLRKYFPQLTGNELAHGYKFSSALMCAAFYNNPECIRVLHSCFPDIDPNLSDEYGHTALLVAMQYPECISVLIECFPNIDSNKQGDTALMYACKQGWPQSIALLTTYFPSIDVNMRDKKGKTALMWVIQLKDEKCLMALCESFPNIDPNIQNRYGETALMVALSQDNSEPIISQLHKFFPDIDPNKQDKRQNTALMYLLKSYNCTVESVRCFLDTFPNVDAKIQNAQGETALTPAIEEGKAPIVELLLKRFPDIISLKNLAGQTTLMLAIKKKRKKNRINLISMLLKHIAQMQ